MANTQRSVEYQKLMEATDKLNEAQKKYHETIMQFVSTGPVAPGKAAAPPKRILDDKGMKEIDDAEAVKDKANEVFKQALNAYYVARV